MAGGALSKARMAYGSTDELVRQRRKRFVPVRDLHANMLPTCSCRPRAFDERRVPRLDLKLTGREPTRVVRRHHCLNSRVAELAKSFEFNNESLGDVRYHPHSTLPISSHLIWFASSPPSFLTGTMSAHHGCVALLMISNAAAGWSAGPRAPLPTTQNGSRFQRPHSDDVMSNTCFACHGPDERN